MPTETAFLDKDHNFVQPEKAHYYVRTETDAEGRVIDEVWVRLEPQPDAEAIKRAYLALLNRQRPWLWVSGAGMLMMATALALSLASLVGPGLSLVVGAIGAAASLAALVALRR
jgi:hypothetical protein